MNRTFEVIEVYTGSRQIKAYKHARFLRLLVTRCCTENIDKNDI